MIKYLHIISIFIFFLIVTSCDTSGGFTPTVETPLGVNISLSGDRIVVGDQLIISIDVANADSLYALALEFNYNSSIFDIDSVAFGDLFSTPFITDNSNFLIDGEVSVSVSVPPLDFNAIQRTSNGTACKIFLKSKLAGTDLLYISSIHMIKSNGDFIDGYGGLSIATDSVEIIQ